MSQATNKKRRASIPDPSQNPPQRAEFAYRDELARLLRETTRSSRAFSRVYNETLGEAEAAESTDDLLSALVDVFAAAERATSALEACEGLSPEGADFVTSARAALELTEIGIGLVIGGRYVEDDAA